MNPTQPARRRAAGLAGIAVAITASILLLALALAPEAAYAASGIGKRVGNEVETWGKAILLGVVGLVAIPVLMKRDVAGGAVLAGLAVLVGGFVFAEGAVKNVITSLWRAIGG